MTEIYDRFAITSKYHVRSFSDNQNTYVFNTYEEAEYFRKTQCLLALLKDKGFPDRKSVSHENVALFIVNNFKEILSIFR